MTADNQNNEISFRHFFFVGIICLLTGISIWIFSDLAHASGPLGIGIVALLTGLLNKDKWEKL